MGRGEVWWADLPDPTNSEPGFRRPVLIVQADEFNRSRIRTVIAAAISSNLSLAAAPGNVSLSKRSVGLNRESVVNVSQVITLDKTFLTERVGRLPDGKLREVEDGLRLCVRLITNWKIPPTKGEISGHCLSLHSNTSFAILKIKSSHDSIFSILQCYLERFQNEGLSILFQVYLAQSGYFFSSCVRLVL